MGRLVQHNVYNARRSWRRTGSMDMKVKELIAELQQYDPELEVWTSDDGEGNNYRPVGGSSLDKYGDTWGNSDAPIHPEDIQNREYRDDHDTEEEYEGWLDSLVERVTIWPSW